MLGEHPDAASPVPDETATPDGRSARATRVIDLLLDAGFLLRHHLDAELGRLGLTPAVARALYQLDPEQPLPARDLAELLACDRSNVTGLVDRLEEAGLVERHVEPTDRRIKTLVVTEAGRLVQSQLRRMRAECDRFLGELTDPELGHLCALLDKADLRTR
jgi:DNA-binding MarR family transcriptional regulator